MQSPLFSGRARLWSLVLSALLLAPLAAPARPVQAGPPIRVVDCDVRSLVDAARATAQPVASVDLSAADDPEVEETGLPPIVGSIPKPAGISEDDTKALTPLATVSRETALRNARSVLADADGRKFDKPAVEGEDNFLVWTIPTTLRDGVAGFNKELEVKVDAGGNGDVLSIECD